MSLDCRWFSRNYRAILLQSIYGKPIWVQSSFQLLHPKVNIQKTNALSGRAADFSTEPPRRIQNSWGCRNEHSGILWGFQMFPMFSSLKLYSDGISCVETISCGSWHDRVAVWCYLDRHNRLSACVWEQHLATACEKWLLLTTLDFTIKGSPWPYHRRYL